MNKSKELYKELKDYYFDTNSTLINAINFDYKLQELKELAELGEMFKEILNNRKFEIELSNPYEYFDTIEDIKIYYEKIKVIKNE